MWQQTWQICTLKDLPPLPQGEAMLHRGLLLPVPSGLAQDPGGKGRQVLSMALDAELLFPLGPDLSAYLFSTPK